MHDLLLALSFIAVLVTPALVAMHISIKTLGWERRVPLRVARLSQRRTPPGMGGFLPY